jgi:hypothetical protein
MARVSVEDETGGCAKAARRLRRDEGGVRCVCVASGVRGRVVSSDEGNRRGVHVGRSGPVDRSILRSRTQTKIPYEITRTVLIRFIWVFSLNRISATAWSRSARSVATTMTWWGVPPPRSTSTRASSRLTPRKRSRRSSRASSSARRRRPVVATANPTPARAANASVGNPKGKRAERKGRFSRVG